MPNQSDATGVWFAMEMPDNLPLGEGEPIPKMRPVVITGTQDEAAEQLTGLVTRDAIFAGGAEKPRNVITSKWGRTCVEVLAIAVDEKAKYADKRRVYWAAWRTDVPTYQVQHLARLPPAETAA
jgi:hypothetical protein